MATLAWGAADPLIGTDVWGNSLELLCDAHKRGVRSYLQTLYVVALLNDEGGLDVQTWTATEDACFCVRNCGVEKYITTEFWAPPGVGAPDRFVIDLTPAQTST